MPNSIIHQATSETSWRILSLLRHGETRIHLLKVALELNESTFSHALQRLEVRGLVDTQQHGREKSARLSDKGRIVFSGLQALCFTLTGKDGSLTADDAAMNKLTNESSARAAASV
ncbi:helix-turn-helix transcriptional regulator [bacterium]|nr:helix-turn-helix transcriptional regulator [bacterium]